MTRAFLLVALSLAAMTVPAQAQTPNGPVQGAVQGTVEGTATVGEPAFEGRHSEVFVFKTPHHADYQTDRHERAVNVGLARGAASAEEVEPDIRRRDGSHLRYVA